jgi:hypothetical protein
MRKCNKCSTERKVSKFRYGKRTCKKCEYRWKQRFLRSLVQDKRLTAKERLAFRLGYMGTAFMMMSPHLLAHGSMGAVTYVVAGILLTPQVFILKQWNLVAVNLNVAIGYLIYLYNL